MSEADLIFTVLAELSTRQIAETMEVKGFKENMIPAKKGGAIAKNACQELVEKTGKKIVILGIFFKKTEYKKVIES
jgi:hypothetical protein